MQGLITSIALTGVPYNFPGATASGGTISWSIKNTIGAGEISPALPATGVLHPRIHTFWYRGYNYYLNGNRQLWDRKQ